MFHLWSMSIDVCAIKHNDHIPYLNFISCINLQLPITKRKGKIRKARYMHGYYKVARLLVTQSPFRSP